MPYREKAVQDHFYHLYNRGNNFENIFFEERNYKFLLNRMIYYFDIHIDIIAYVLMPNHYHFIVEVKKNDFLEKALQKFCTSYTKAINKSRNRVGHLFQGRYKLKLVPENNYLLHLSRYIHLNPVRKGLVNHPIEWKFSSYSKYLGEMGQAFVKPDIILDQVNDYEDFVLSFQENQNFYLKDILFD
ncbi:MAG: transposase [Ignavibacteriae bacterium]|nr:transposase [Ignavibacteriota bacterium]NOG98262.1 transposase [Ignavibacteriota bacterium]